MTYRKEYMKKYMRRYWKKNPDRYKSHLEGMMRFAKSKEGKEYRRKQQKKWLSINKTYMSDYGRSMRIMRKKKGICMRCGKVKVIDYVECRKCKGHMKK